MISFIFDLFKRLLLLRKLVEILPVSLNEEDSQYDCNQGYALPETQHACVFLWLADRNMLTYNCIIHMH